MEVVFFFFKKSNEVWGIAFQNKKKLNGVLYFFVNIVNIILISADGLAHDTFVPLLFENRFKRSFWRLFLKILVVLKKKLDNVIRFSVTKIDIPSNFMLSQSKLASEKRHRKGILG